MLHKDLELFIIIIYCRVVTAQCCIIITGAVFLWGGSTMPEYTENSCSGKRVQCLNLQSYSDIVLKILCYGSKI